MNKEQVYDQQIYPLMAQIIEIAREHKIAMVASFAVPTEGDPDLMVSTALPDEQDDLAKLPGVLGQMVRTLISVALPTAINPRSIEWAERLPAARAD